LNLFVHRKGGDTD